ncbi:murein transglycosylase A [Hydrogenophaga sp.]|uniref:murein transglycosylase A n=1 Tax=Hydrogenophaga sp. TaxID=1904254 RepID=UPI0027193280|nr:MltA domain-containing protein [Hydrogenophaga sp.]MDO9439203.1 MltA domain-containing protein [Hydrogenophaga sp.]
MVHHTMNTSNNSAPSASSIKRIMDRKQRSTGEVEGRGLAGALRWLASALIVGSLVACASDPRPYPPRPAPTVPSGPPVVSVPDDGVALPPAIARGKSLWVPVRWSELPGWGQDSLHEVWNAWVRGCERPVAGHAGLCAEVRQLSIGSAAEQQAWVVRRFMPYRVTEPDGSAPAGLLTGYYEPIMPASRVPTATHRVPLYGPPAGLRSGQTWYSRQEIDTLPAAQAALQGRAIAWLADPIDALILQIQGSGRLNIVEADGRARQVRVAFAAHNGHPYQSVGRWLLDQRAINEASWAAIKAWAIQNPQRLNDMLWSNPRTVFFREEALSDLDARFGPRGAQNVPLTPGRSIAVDPQSIPYGTPVWLATQGPTLNLQRLVMAQDTGGAIVGAVRADLFTGWGDWHEEAYTTAAALKQPLQLWVLWPR